MKKKLVLGVTAGISAFAAVTASASTLGGVTTEKVGASTSVVASCDSDGVTVGYTTGYDKGTYKVTGVKLSDIDAKCSGQTVTVTLFDGEKVSLGEKSAANAGTTQTLAMPSAVDAEALKGVAVVIAG